MHRPAQIILELQLAGDNAGKDVANQLAHDRRDHRRLAQQQISGFLNSANQIEQPLQRLLAPAIARMLPLRLLFRANGCSMQPVNLDG